MPEYYKRIKSGIVFKFLFEATHKTTIIFFVYEDMEGNKYTREKEDFLNKFERCDPPTYSDREALHRYINGRLERYS